MFQQKCSNKNVPTKMFQQKCSNKNVPLRFFLVVFCVEKNTYRVAFAVKLEIHAAACEIICILGVSCSLRVCSVPACVRARRSDI